jgi:hypothetical protein
VSGVKGVTNAITVGAAERATGPGH